MEHNNLGRNFSDVYSIVELVKEAYEAGFNAEEFEINIVNVESQEKSRRTRSLVIKISPYTRYFETLFIE